MTDRSRHYGWLFGVSLGLSLAIHIGLAAYLLPREPRKSGALDRQTIAISVNLETTDILDSIETSATTEAAATASTPSAESIPPDEAKEQEAEQQTPPAETEQAEAEAEAEPATPPEVAETGTPADTPKTDVLTKDAERQRIAEEALERAVAAEAEKREAEQAEAERRERENAQRMAEEQARLRREAEAREAEKERRAEARKRAENDAKDQRQRAAASTAASGSSGRQASQGRVSASQGSVRDYGAMVRARIARNKPPGGERGSVVVSIALSTSGQLVSARVSSSSGRPSLDQSALAAVRRSSPFPEPPRGATSGQLRFTMRFNFDVR